jgi:phosphoesterase RecJ-like protein
MIDAAIPKRSEALLSKARKIVCICHRGPDGDAVGALLGIAGLLEKRFPDAEVSMHCVDAVPETFHFLPNVLRVQGAPDLSDVSSTAAVVVDCGEPKMTELHVSHPMLFDGTVPLVNIDHHQGNPAFGTENCIDVSASSACEIIADMAEALGWEIDSDIATCLLTGIYTDTGGLLHSNTTSKVYRTVSRLLRSGARSQQIVSAVFRTAKLSTLRLWGRVLEKIGITEEQGAISAVTEADFRATGADPAELTGAIDYLNAVPGMRFSLILSEREGKVKGSLRTLRDDVDVAAMAGRLSGGGHRKAAGFALPGRLKQETRWKVVDGPPAKDQQESQ